jgi:acyl-CoA synthetase (AMP-forming)/AMP-acid ligase II
LTRRTRIRPSTVNLLMSIRCLVTSFATRLLASLLLLSPSTAKTATDRQALHVLNRGDRCVSVRSWLPRATAQGYYAVPQIGAVLVPINYRLVPDDFEYIVNHCGAKVVRAHADYIEALDGIRSRLPGVLSLPCSDSTPG